MEQLLTRGSSVPVPLVYGGCHRGARARLRVSTRVCEGGNVAERGGGDHSGRLFAIKRVFMSGHLSTDGAELCQRAGSIHFCARHPSYRGHRTATWSSVCAMANRRGLDTPHMRLDATRRAEPRIERRGQQCPHASKLSNGTTSEVHLQRRENGGGLATAHRSQPFVHLLADAHSAAVRGPGVHCHQIAFLKYF